MDPGIDNSSLSDVESYPGGDPEASLLCDPYPDESSVMIPESEVQDEAETSLLVREDETMAVLVEYLQGGTPWDSDERLAGFGPKEPESEGDIVEYGMKDEGEVEEEGVEEMVAEMMQSVRKGESRLKSAVGSVGSPPLIPASRPATPLADHPSSSSAELSPRQKLKASLLAKEKRPFLPLTVKNLKLLLDMFRIRHEEGYKFNPQEVFYRGSEKEGKNASVDENSARSDQHLPFHDSLLAFLAVLFSISEETRDTYATRTLVAFRRTFELLFGEASIHKWVRLGPKEGPARRQKSDKRKGGRDDSAAVQKKKKQKQTKPKKRYGVEIPKLKKLSFYQVLEVRDDCEEQYGQGTDAALVEFLKRIKILDDAAIAKCKGSSSRPLGVNLGQRAGKRARSQSNGQYPTKKLKLGKTGLGANGALSRLDLVVEDLARQTEMMTRFGYIKDRGKKGYFVCDAHTGPIYTLTRRLKVLNPLVKEGEGASAQGVHLGNKSKLTPEEYARKLSPYKVAALFHIAFSSEPFFKALIKVS